MERHLQEELREFIGVEGPQMEALDEVCKPLIRRWCEAMQDGNPLYTDEDYARKSKYGSVIAPPTMLMAWSMNPLWPPRESALSSLGRAMEILDKAGFTQVMIVGSTQKYYHPLFPGDRVSFTHRVDSVSGEKQTGLGKGYFITSIFTYTNQKGDLIGTQSLTMLKYRVEP